MKRVYISGGISKDPGAKYKFLAAEAALERLGVEPFNTFSFGESYAAQRMGFVPWEEYMRIEIPELCFRDVICLIDDDYVVDSEGVALEVTIANKLKIPLWKYNVTTGLVTDEHGEILEDVVE